MEFIEVELCFVRKSILLSMERFGLPSEKVAMVGLRLQEEPFLGVAAPDIGANVFEFYWTEWQYKEHYRVLYRRLDTLEKTQIAVIRFERVDSAPEEASVWREPARYRSIGQQPVFKHLRNSGENGGWHTVRGL